MKQNLLWTLGLGILALWLNSRGIVVYGELELRLGGVAALAAAIALGPVWGAGVALLGGLDHGISAELSRAWPWLGLPVLQAFWLGLWSRRNWMPLTIDLAFWLIIGVPGLLLMGQAAVDPQAGTVGLLAVHLPIQGLTSTVVAELLLLLGPSWRATSSFHWLPAATPRSLRRQVVHWFALATMLPIWWVAIRLGNQHAVEQEKRWSEEMRHSSAGVADRPSDYLLRHRSAIEALARLQELQPTTDVSTVQERMSAFLGVNNDFSTFLMTDAEGTIVVGFPNLGRQGEPWWQGGDKVSQRDYFQVPMTTGEPYISDLFVGKGYGTELIIGVSAPIRLADQSLAGIVEGSLNVDLLHQMEQYLPDQAAELMVIDRAGRVLYSSDRESFPFLESPSLQLPAGDGPGPPAGIFLSKPNGDSMLAARSAVPLAGWQVLTKIPAQKVRAAADQVYRAYGLAMLGALLLASGVALWVAKRLTRPLEDLVSLSEAFQADGSLRRAPSLPPGTPSEAADLLSGFQEMAGRLSQSYRRLRHTLDDRETLNQELETVLAELDQRVQTRTSELAAATSRAEDLQSQYRRLVDGIGAVVWEFDLAQQRFSFVNRRLCRLIGDSEELWYEDAERWRRFLSPSDQRRVLVNGHRLSSPKGPSEAELELELRLESGRRRWVRTMIGVYGDQGKRSLRGLTVDITEERRRQQDDLRRRKLESVGVLAGGIAHDFNNLLTAVLGNLSLAQLELVSAETEASSGERLAELLSGIESAGLDARDLSQKLLTFARGGAPIRRQLQLVELVEKSCGAARRQGFDVEVTSPQDLSPISGDSDQLSQVLRELLSNACQALGRQGTVRIALSNVVLTEGPGGDLPAGSYVLLKVIDNGSGIAQKHLEKIFDPYFTTKDAGRGFGLAIAYSIVQAHGGKIAVSSQSGEGTCFSIWLPASDEPVTSDPATAAPMPTSSGRVLVMDDEPSVRLVAKRMLSRLGWEVQLAADGEQALELYSQARDRPGSEFDLVITDLTVPGGMGGAQTMRRLRQLDPAVRAVVCSGYSHDPVMAEYRRHGFVGVMAKPFSLRTLRSTLDEAMAADVDSTAESD